MKSWKDLKAADVMTHPAICVNLDASVRDVATTLSEHRISGVLVVDPRQQPVGVVTLQDLAAHVSGLERPPAGPAFYRSSESEEAPDRWEGDFWDEIGSSPMGETPISEVMSPDVIAVVDDAPLSDVVRVLLEKRIHRVFVLREERVAGVITTMDILRALKDGLANEKQRRMRAS